MRHLRSRFVLSLAALGTLAACGGGGSSNTPGGGGTSVVVRDGGTGGASGATVTMTANGVSPTTVTVAVGQTVTFVNNDTRAHDLVGGVDPSHPECPEITIAGFLTPGQSRETGVFTTARTCEYHDHTALSVPAFQGRIIIR